jgi:hypothetical protein
MLRRHLLSTAFILLAAANACGREPAARPLNSTPPIFALPASSRPAASNVVRRTAPLPHRQPLTLTPTKPVASPTSADAKNPAPPPWFGTSTIPHHRRSLGW